MVRHILTGILAVVQQRHKVHRLRDSLTNEKRGCGVQGSSLFSTRTSPALTLQCSLSFHAPKITPEHSRLLCSSSENTGVSLSCRRLAASVRRSRLGGQTLVILAGTCNLGVAAGLLVSRMFVKADRRDRYTAASGSSRAWLCWRGGREGADRGGHGHHQPLAGWRSSATLMCRCM